MVKVKYRTTGQSPQPLSFGFFARLRHNKSGKQEASLLFVTGDLDECVNLKVIREILSMKLDFKAESMRWWVGQTTADADDRGGVTSSLGRELIQSKQDNREVCEMNPIL